MALITYYVDPTQGTNGNGSSGSPFNTMAACFTAIRGDTNFQNGTNNYLVNVKAGADATLVNADLTVAATTTAQTLTIQPLTTADQHTGVRGTGYRVTNSFSVYNSNTHLTVLVNGIAAEGFGCNGNGPTTFQNCFSFDSNSTSNAGFFTGGGTSTKYINCLAVNSLAAGFKQDNNLNSPTVTYINCTTIHTVASSTVSYGFWNASGTMNLINCYSGGNVTEAYNSVSSFVTCMHDTATTFTGSTKNIALSTANFVNVTAGSENGHLVSGSALIGAGTGPSSNANVPTTDFEGDARTGTTTDIGVDQYAIVASVTPTPTVTPTNTVTPTSTPTNTPTNTVTPSITASVTPTNTLTPTVTPTITPTNTVTPTRTYTVTVSERLINLSNVVQSSVTGITACIYAGVPTSGSPNPFLVQAGLSSDTNGFVTFTFNSGSLAVNQAIWVIFFLDGSPAKGAIRKITPTYT